jgi:hypothetical protein
MARGPGFVCFVPDDRTLTVTRAVTLIVTLILALGVLRFIKTSRLVCGGTRSTPSRYYYFRREGCWGFLRVSFSRPTVIIYFCATR